jgi:urease accessory protein
MLGDSASLLRLLHLADSALPIGATAHSFGLETLVQDGDVDLPLLGRWFEDYLRETGTVDAWFCRRAFRLGAQAGPVAGGLLAGSVLLSDWRAANQELSALRAGRESRAASHALGGRLLRLLADLEPQPLWQTILAVQDAESHYACVFGLGGVMLGLPEEDVVVALLRQNVAGLISACQRLMPLGQGRAGQLLWRLQEAITACAAAAHEQPYSFTALLDLGSMRHPLRPVRLFIS